MISEKEDYDFVMQDLLDKEYTAIQPLGNGAFGEDVASIIIRKSSWHLQKCTWLILKHP